MTEGKNPTIRLTIEGMNGEEPDAVLVAQTIERFAKLLECIDRKMGNGEKSFDLRIVGYETVAK